MGTLEDWRESQSNEPQPCPQGAYSVAGEMKHPEQTQSPHIYHNKSNYWHKLSHVLTNESWNILANIHYIKFQPNISKKNFF